MSSNSRLVCLAALTVVLCLPSVARADLIMDHEPVEHLKAHLQKNGDEMTEKLKSFLQLPQQEINRKTAQMEKNLKKVLKREAHVSAFLLKGTTVLAERTASEIQFNSTFLLPHGVLLPILSTTLPILLESYKRELLYNAMGDVLKGNHRDHHDVKDYLSLSLHELVTNLPRKDSSANLDDPTLLSDINRRGKAAFFYVNTVLETVAEDAWKDALISVAMDHSIFTDNGQMLTHFKDLGMYVETLSSDLINFFEVSKSDQYQLDAGHYLYGWWFNCPCGSSGDKESACLAPFLPSDSLAVLNPAIRIYSVPRLRLHLIVGNTGETAGTHTLTDVLRQDKLIWKAIYSVIDPSSTKDVKAEKQEKDAGPQSTETGEAKDTNRPEGAPTEPPRKSDQSVQEDEVVGESMRKNKASASTSKSDTTPSQKTKVSEKREDDVVVDEMGEEKDKDQPLMIRVIRMGWIVSVFLFYTIFSHVWVYWILHLLWLVCSYLFSGVYLPRPKTAKQD